MDGFDSGTQNAGFEFEQTFNVVGTINYKCTPHCAMPMRGVIRVADFTLSCAPNPVTIPQNGSGNVTCTLGSLNGFNKTITLDTTGLPGGVTDSFNPNPATPPANNTTTSTLTLNVGAVGPGNYPFTVTATNDDLVRTFNMTLTVAAVVPDFSLACNPASVTPPLGGSDTTTCTVSSQNAYSDLVNLACSSLPAGITCSFNPTGVTPPADGSANSTLTVDLDVSVQAGSYNISLDGTDGVLSHSSPLAVNVAPLFIEDFEDGVADGFTFLKGTWNVANGELSGTHTRKSNALSAFVMQPEHTVEADVRTNGGFGSRTSVLAWQVDKRTLVEVLVKEAENRWVLKRRVGGPVVAKAKAIRDIAPNTNYRVKLEHDGTAYRLSIDGVEIIVLNAPAPTPGVPGFRVKAVTSFFGELVVY
jgi:hypothetical protein